MEAFVAAQRADGNPEFTVDSAGNSSDLYVVKFIEPIAFNRAALGKDVGREAVRREAAERAAHRLHLEIETARAKGVQSPTALARSLTERAVSTPLGASVWTHTTIARVIARVSS